MDQIAFTHLRDMGPLPALVEKHGGTHVLEKVFQSAGLPVTAAFEREGYIPVHSMVCLIEQAAQLLGDDLFGLRLGFQMAPTDFGTWVRYVIAAPDVGGMIRRSIRTLQYHISSGSFELKIKSPYAKWQVATLDRADPGYRHHTDHVIGPMLTALRCYLGPKWRPSWIELEYARPACWQEIEDAFGTPVRFAQPTTGIVFPEALIDVRLPAVLPAGNAVSLSDLKRIVRAQPPRSIVDAVEAIVSLRLIDGRSDLEGTAHLMNIGPRMLQRKLKEQNTSYRELLEHLRIARSQGLMNETNMTITEIAIEVGYNDLAAFSRAFRRHAGMPPSEMRRTVT